MSGRRIYFPPARHSKNGEMMKNLLKNTTSFAIITCLIIILSACSNSTQLEKLQKDNEVWLNSAREATLGYHFSLQPDLTWGMTVDEVSKIVNGPFEDDYETYLSTWSFGALPQDNKWKEDSDRINQDSFKKTDIKCFYTFDQEGRLTEYGYQHYLPILDQYDFLKEYYTKMFGKPKNEEYIWKDKNYKPSGEEDLYKEFKNGKVKVLTAWDIDQLGTILVIDWLNDPVESNNNFGQISFYEKTADINIDKESEK